MLGAWSALQWKVVLDLFFFFWTLNDLQGKIEDSADSFLHLFCLLNSFLFNMWDRFSSDEINK